MRLERFYKSNETAISKILESLANRLTFRENIQAVEIDVADSGAANTEFTVRHALGKTPRVYIWNIDQAGIVYDSRRANWTSQEMYLKCSVANAALTLTIT